MKGTLQITDECSFSYGHGDYGLFRGGVVTSAPPTYFLDIVTFFEQFFKVGWLFHYFQEGGFGRTW